MADVVWRPEALDDLRRIIGHIDQFDSAAAHGVGVRLYELGESLAEFPRRGRPCDDGTREMTAGSPYVLRYEVDERQVIILSIRHGRQRPVS